MPFPVRVAGARRRVALAICGCLALLLGPLPGSLRGEGFSLLNYNVHGNSVDDWSTNSPQVRAIGRQVQHLRPDVLTLQEIPFPLSWEMTNFVAAFLPGYHLAANSGTDGYIRSVILSRHPIIRSAKWLDGVSLAAFGNDGRFTRDLFEAEIAVPGLSQPLHVFTTHLKSGQDSASAARRGAEARAISNFFATVFLPQHPRRPYVLTGDMNEDVDQPPSATGQPFASLASSGTNLRMTAPVDPANGNSRTFSTRTAQLSRRYDYILPCGLLATNVLSSAVFRTDTLTGDIAPLLSTDSETASDHLPIWMVFRDPYKSPMRITPLLLAQGSLRLVWDSVPGGLYRIESSTNLTHWSEIAAGLEATGEHAAFTVEAVRPTTVFRIRLGQP